MSLPEIEYSSLRNTIATRGTLRILLLFLTLSTWAVLAVLLLAVSVSATASLVSLAVLAGGFEAIHALHVGIERIGRYLQVYYERAAEGPRWETVAASMDPALPGGGVDPLATVLFVAATIVNLSSATVSDSTTLELSGVGIFHGLLVVRVLRARRAAARQRAVELESLEALQDTRSRSR